TSIFSICEPSPAYEKPPLLRAASRAERDRSSEAGSAPTRSRFLLAHFGDHASGSHVGTEKFFRSSTAFAYTERSRFASSSNLTTEGRTDFGSLAYFASSSAAAFSSASFASWANLASSA